MAKLKVNVPLLNKRSLPVPDTRDKGNITGKVKDGFSFESVEQQTNAAGEWFKDKDGSWYWGGGLSGVSEALALNRLPVAGVENDLSKKIILKAPATSTGNGIVIGILDTGVDMLHPSIGNACISNQDFLTMPHDAVIKNDHGTKVAGVLIGNDDKMKGLVVDAKIRSYRTNDNDGNTDDGAIINALNDIITNNTKIDILNLSLDVTTARMGEVQACVDTLVAKGIVVVVAGFSQLFGDISNLANINGTFPAGIIEEDDFLNVKTTGLNNKYSLTFLNKSMVSLGLFNSNNAHPDFFSSSAYTAVTTGIIAMFLGSRAIPAESRITAVKNYLSNTSFNIKGETIITPFKPYTNEKV